MCVFVLVSMSVSVSVCVFVLVSMSVSVSVPYIFLSLFHLTADHTALCWCSDNLGHCLQARLGLKPSPSDDSAYGFCSHPSSLPLLAAIAQPCGTSFTLESCVGEYIYWTLYTYFVFITLYTHIYIHV